jgi:hypothetical protein
MSTSNLVNEIRVPSNVGFATNISPDGQAATVIFDNLYIGLGPAQQGLAGTLNQTAIQSKVFTVVIPYSTDQESVAMAIDVRGYVNTEPGAIVRLVACAGGTTNVLDVSQKTAGPIYLKGKSKEAVVAEHADIQLGDFINRVEFTVQTNAAKPVCQITLLLLVEHNTDTAGSGGALLAVDSLDLSIAAPNKKA